ncbi:MAG: nitroreductase family protein [Promethearchaeota archaeon]
MTYGRLAAQSSGLGTCWNGFINIASQHNKKIMKLAGVRGKRIGAFMIGYGRVNQSADC